MKCREFIDLVDPWIDGLLPAAEADAVAAHAAACEACRGEADRAGRFRALLEDAGGAAVANAADRVASDLARVAVTDDSARPGFLRRFAVPFAAAAALVAGLGIGGLAGGVFSAADATIPEGTGPARIVRGEHRRLAEGRTVVADADTVLDVLPGSRGERVQLSEGSAMFQVERGRPFTVVTELGDVDVRGTLFHVERRRDGSMSVGVVSGVVVFRPKGGGTTRTLRSGHLLDIGADGSQQMVSRSDVADLVMRTQMQSMEIEALLGDLQKRDEEIAALREEMGGIDPVPGVRRTSDRPIDWRELGSAARRLLGRSTNPRDPANFEALAAFLQHISKLREFTGVENYEDLPWHPTVIAGIAAGFVDALAPDAPEGSRARAAAAIASAARAAEPHVREGVAAEAAEARLRMARDIVVAVRDELGVAAAAEIVRSPLVTRDGARIMVVPDTDDSIRLVVEGWATRYGVPAERRPDLTSLAESWRAATKSAQAAIASDLGAEADVFLFPARVPGRHERGTADPKAPQDDGEAVRAALRRIDAKLLLVQPKADVERAIRTMLAPEDSVKMVRESHEAYLWTFR